MNGRRTRNMCEPMAATSSVSSVTLSIRKGSYPQQTARKRDLFAITRPPGAFNGTVTPASRDS